MLAWRWGLNPQIIWNEISFGEMLVYCQQAQSQMLAENGVREIVVGYIGDETEFKPQLRPVSVSDLQAVGPGKTMKISELPEGVRDIYEAEQHRLATGEVMQVEEFKRRKREGRIK